MRGLRAIPAGGLVVGALMRGGARPVDRDAVTTSMAEMSLPLPSALWALVPAQAQAPLLEWFAALHAESQARRARIRDLEAQLEQHAAEPPRAPVRLSWSRCPHCRARLHWEYKVCTVPLDGLATYGPPDRLTRHGGALSAEFAEAYDLRVRRHLAREADEGWEPAEATDFPAMWALGRVRFEQQHRVLDLLLGGSTYRYRAVTIRLRRLMPRYCPPR